TGRARRPALTPARTRLRGGSPAGAPPEEAQPPAHRTHPPPGENPHNLPVPSSPPAGASPPSPPCSGSRPASPQGPRTHRRRGPPAELVAGRAQYRAVARGIGGFKDGAVQSHDQPVAVIGADNTGRAQGSASAVEEQFERTSAQTLARLGEGRVNGFSVIWGGM